jgi:hypothetical protein
VIAMAHLEDRAIRVVLRDMENHVAGGAGLESYEEDHAMIVLIREELRPSRLGYDLEYIMARAAQQFWKRAQA